MTVAELPEAAGASDAGRPLLTLVAEDVPDDRLAVEELGTRIVGLAGRLAAATCRWLLLVAAFDAREGFSRFGLPNTAWWLAHYCGLSRRTARDHVRVARTLAAHPGLAAAMGAGRVSYSHVRAISRVAELGDERLVTDLVSVAEHGTIAQLEDLVRGLRCVDDNGRDTDEPIVEAVSHRWRPDSLWSLSAKLDPEHGALVQAAIEQVARREAITHAQALARIAEIALAAVSGSSAAPGGPEDAAPADHPAPSLRGDEYAAVVIHLDASAVPPQTDAASSGPAPANGSGGAGTGSAEPIRPRPYARVARGPGLSDAVIKRLLCSGRIRTVVSGDAPRPGVRGTHRSLLDLGRSHRLVSRMQFRALLLRDGGCVHPGCATTTGLEAHHVRHWLHGGRTDLDNLVLVCRRHHHAHHDGAFRIVALGHGRFRFLTADGRELPQHVDPATFEGTSRRIEDEHPDVAPTAATTRWDGSRLDRDHAVHAFAQRLDTADRRVVA